MSLFPKQRKLHSSRRAFTLIELMIVVFIVLLLAAISLPTVRNLLKDGRSAHQARQVVTILREARSRAIATKSEVGVLFDRLGTTNDFLRSTSLQMRMSNSVPPYAGESAAARAVLFHDPPANTGNAQVATLTATGPTNAAFFTAADCPLLYLSAVNGAGANQPIGVFDRLELQGGRSVVMIRMLAVAAADSMGMGDGTKVIFDPRERLFDSQSSAASTTLPTVAFPGSIQQRSSSTAVRFKIHRKPNVSMVGGLTLLKGMAIDLNYSGIGPAGVQLSQFVIAPGATPTTDVNCGGVAIVFAPDGSVAYMNYGVNVAGAVVNSVEHPPSNIYLCLGRLDGIRPDSLYDTTNKPPANIMNLESSWIVINPFTGRIQASPSASVDASTLAGGGLGALSSAVLQSRALAFQSDKLSKY
ncbi:MAG: prepilin-type N-terminal cleavage/methylation domain-containing protein [Pirellulaceae bacterium]|nr:prepilin-type N-terminal cleavage/methylation domain-containing protein [Pirellulaceae bacterium]